MCQKLSFPELKLYLVSKGYPNYPYMKKITLHVYTPAFSHLVTPLFTVKYDRHPNKVGITVIIVGLFRVLPLNMLIMNL